MPIKALVLRHPLIIVFCYISAVGLLFIAGAYEFSRYSREQEILSMAESYATALISAHEYYSTEIVPRAVEAGVKLSHSFKDTSDELPFPGTFANDYGLSLNKKLPGLSMKLYSEYPFPWDMSRQLDDFQRDALSFLSQHPGGKYLRLLHGADGDTLRYALPMIMQESCVDCHNRPDFQFPRIWAIGDFRGVREVSLPVAPGAPVNRRVVTLGALFAAVSALAGVLLIWPVVTRLRTALSQSQALAAKLDHMAMHDFLTQLPGKRLGHDRIIQAIHQATRNAANAAVLFVDLDGFKQINDLMGHEAGDEALRAVAQRILGVVRSVDTVARLGGDEFLVVLTNIRGAHEASQTAQRILDEMAKPFSLEPGEANLGASIGIALYPNNGNSPDELIREADQAMYGVKATGKNGYRFAEGKAET